jgi:toxin CptA
MQIPSLLVALGAAGVMGFANQRGGTCTVAAIEEIVATRRFKRLVALLEASLWVAAGLLLLNAMNALPAMPPGYAPGLWTIGGGILFGLGAFVNRACLFGTVARLGSGEWAYAATPLGLFAGSLATAGVQWATRLDQASIVLAASASGGLVALTFLIARLATHGVAIGRYNRPILEHLWSPYVATTIIGLAFLTTFATAGNWDYADLLTDLARGKTVGWLPRALLAFALVGGAIIGGWTAGRVQSGLPRPSKLFRHFAGGFLMGSGASVIPGGNTGLVLLGMPMLWPYAWLAFITICTTIYIAIQLTQASPKAPSAR